MRTGLIKAAEEHADQSVGRPRYRPLRFRQRAAVTTLAQAESAQSSRDAVSRPTVPRAVRREVLQRGLDVLPEVRAKIALLEIVLGSGRP